jgi:signal transduction histidine kinase/CheY-like chemotaxis protein
MKSEKGIKITVFLSYSIILLLVGLISYFTFTSFNLLVRSSDKLAQPNERIDLLHDIIYAIHNTESSIRSYSLTERESHLNAYFVSLSQINDMVDTLYKLAGDDDFIKKTVDSINIELLNKTQILEQFILIRRLDKNSVFYYEAVDEIVKASSRQSIMPGNVENAITDSLLLPEQPSVDQLPSDREEITREKDNVFQRIRSFFSGSKSEKPTPPEAENDSIIQEQVLQQISTDSIISDSKDTVHLKREIENAMSQLFQQLYQRQQAIRDTENRILLNDKKVMDRIWQLVTRLEEYEKTNALKEASFAHATVEETSEKIFILIVVSFIVMLVFFWLFVTDINKSRFYKKQLMAEKARAEDLLLVKQRFMANISHEIRTPLNSIIGFSEQLKKLKIKDDASLFVSAISQSSSHLLEIVNDILDFSKMEAGKINLDPADTDLVDLVEQVYISLEGMAQSKGLNFTVSTDTLTHRYYLCDPLRLKQVLINLVNNAIKFTHEGSVVVSLTQKADDSDKSSNKVMVCITVADTGIGMSEADQKRIFDEFAQADSNLNRNFGGTGLGLSISRKLVDLMNGNIELESKPGEGATFNVSIPLEPCDGALKTKFADSESLPDDFQAHILLVDDDPLNRLLISSLLDSYRNISLKEASNGQEAIDLLRIEAFDLLITDIQMPGVSGFDLVEQLRSDTNQLNYAIPVIACTADITDATKEGLRKAGIEQYLLKPINEQMFFQTLNGLFNTDKTFHTASTHTNANFSFTQDENQGRRLFDISGLDNFTGGNADTNKKILAAFKTDTQKNIQDLSRDLENDNRKSIHATVHKMSHMFELLKIQSAMSSIAILNKSDLTELSSDELKRNIKDLIKIAEDVLAELD